MAEADRRRLVLPFVLRAAAIGMLISACSSRSVDAVLACQEGCAGSANALTPRPIHRYGFDPTGTNEVLDSVGEHHGTLVGARYGVDQDVGSVVLAGEFQGEFIDLPNHLLWGLRNATFESWVTWRGGGAWQRVFDFGEDETGSAGSRSAPPRSYLFLAFKPEPRAAFKKPPASSPEIVVEAGFAMPENVLTHLAVVVDEDQRALSLYVDGRVRDERRFVDSLSDVYDANDWLGRSLYRLDPEFGGSITEFRVYDRALTPEQLLSSYEAGADEWEKSQ